MNFKTINGKFIFTFTCILFIVFGIVTAISITGYISEGNRDIADLRKQMMENAKLRLSEEVDIAVSLINAIKEKGIKDGVDVEESKKAAKDAVRSLRYGKNGYFWIDNSEYILQVLPSTPEKEGMDRSGLKDLSGKYFVKELVDGAVANGETNVEYMFGKIGDDKPYPKLGHTKLFKEWNWIVGTGVYIDDIDEKVAQEKIVIKERIRNSIIMSIIIFFILTILSIVIIYFASSTITKQIAILVEKFKQGAAGDLTVNVKVEGRDEIADMAKEFNKFILNLLTIVKEIKGISLTVASSSTEMSSQMNSITDGAVEQVARKNELYGNFKLMSESMSEIMDNIKNQVAGLEEVSSSMAEIAQTSNHVAKNAEVTMKMSENTVNEAKVGGESVKKTLEGISKIEILVKNTEGKVIKLSNSSDEIGDIVKTIDEIAGQTNLLALNAAIEAAHAGELGKGFAVVADEIKELAERSQDATKQIEKLIRGIQKEVQLVIEATKESYEEVKNSSALSREAENNLSNIISNIERTNIEVGNISKAMEEQATAVEEISSVIQNVAEGSSNIEFKAVNQIDIIGTANKSLSEISDIIEITTASTEETSAVSHELAGLAEKLDGMIEHFKIGDSNGNTKDIKISKNQEKYRS